jgi:hypothetical protein
MYVSILQGINKSWLSAVYQKLKVNDLIRASIKGWLNLLNKRQASP